MSEPKYLGRPVNHPVQAVDLIDWSGGPIEVRLDCTEFTAICPVTRQPDFGRLVIAYVPDRHLVETKSLKLYLWKYRDEPTFNETVVDRIAGELFEQIRPRWLRVEGVFQPRGGIHVTAVAERGTRPT